LDGSGNAHALVFAALHSSIFMLTKLARKELGSLTMGEAPSPVSEHFIQRVKQGRMV
jgi:hypothetical protein